jgi:hypothetical protein
MGGGAFDGNAKGVFNLHPGSLVRGTPHRGRANRNDPRPGTETAAPFAMAKRAAARAGSTDLVGSGDRLRILPSREGVNALRARTDDWRQRFEAFKLRRIKEVRCVDRLVLSGSVLRAGCLAAGRTPTEGHQCVWSRSVPQSAYVPQAPFKDLLVRTRPRGMGVPTKSTMMSPFLQIHSARTGTIDRNTLYWPLATVLESRGGVDAVVPAQGLSARVERPHASPQPAFGGERTCCF